MAQKTCNHIYRVSDRKEKKNKKKTRIFWYTTCQYQVSTTVVMVLKKSQGLLSPGFTVYPVYGLHSKIYRQLLGSRECCQGNGAFSAFLKRRKTNPTG